MSSGLSDADIKTVAALHAGDLAAIDIATRVRAWAGDPAVKALAEDVRRTRVALDQALVNFAADKNVPLALIQSQGERREASLVVGAEADTAADLTKGPPQERELVHSLEKKSMNDAGIARHALRTAVTPGLRDLLNDFIDKLEDNQSAAALLLRRKL
jgi:3-methyladenine DNA glycosylase AlkC